MRATTKRYIHHYNFPPFSTGETGRVGSPKRREIGHGALAERALLPVIPAEEEFPYTLRIVSEVLETPRRILGIDCVVVRVREFEDDLLMEDTHDWFAQDRDGNVWYFGEIALNYEDGRLVDERYAWSSDEQNEDSGGPWMDSITVDLEKLASLGSDAVLQSHANPNMWAWVEDFGKMHVPRKILEEIVAWVNGDIISYPGLPLARDDQ